MFYANQKNINIFCETLRLDFDANLSFFNEINFLNKNRFKIFFVNFYYIVQNTNL